MKHRWIAFLLASGLVCAAASAHASAPDPVPSPDPMPQVHIEGGWVEARRLRVDCGRDVAPSEAARSVRCALELDFDVGAGGEDGLVRIEAPASAVVEVDGLARAGAIVPAGQIVHVTVRAEAATMRSQAGGGLIADGLFLRHVFLASRSPRIGVPPVTYTPIEWIPFLPGTDIRGTLEVESVEVDVNRASFHVDRTRVEAARTVAPGLGFTIAEIPEPPEDDAVLRHGGPYLALGAVHLAEANEHFGMRAGYEVGLHDWVVLSLAAETDFVSRGAFSFLVEGVSPSVLLGGVSAGIGAVVDVSDRGARGALRLAGGVQLYPVGVVVTADYGPDDGRWTVALMTRLSL